MTNVRLLVTDIDGTLITSQHTLTSRALAAVQRLREANIALAITSSRPPHGLRSLAAQLAITTPLAAFNGAMLLGADFVSIEQDALSADDVVRVKAAFLAADLNTWIYCLDDWFVFDDTTRHVKREVAALGFAPKLLQQAQMPMGTVMKMVGVSDDVSLVARCTKQLREKLVVSASNSHPYYLDVTRAGVNKGTALQRLADLLAVPLSQIAAIGDGGNDVSMFALAGISIAMGNATPDVQRAAQHVTTSHDDEGFANAVERYVL